MIIVIRTVSRMFFFTLRVLTSNNNNYVIFPDIRSESHELTCVYALRTLVANRVGNQDSRLPGSDKSTSFGWFARSRFAEETRRQHFDAWCQTRGASARNIPRELRWQILDMLIF